MLLRVFLGFLYVFLRLFFVFVGFADFSQVSPTSMFGMRLVISGFRRKHQQQKQKHHQHPRNHEQHFKTMFQMYLV